MAKRHHSRMWWRCPSDPRPSTPPGPWLGESGKQSPLRRPERPARVAAPGARCAAARASPATARSAPAAQRVWCDRSCLALQVLINPFSPALRAARRLSADPTTTRPMATFCDFLETSQQKLEKWVALLSLMACPGCCAMWGSAFHHMFQAKCRDAAGWRIEALPAGLRDKYLHGRRRKWLREARATASQLLQDASTVRG